MKIQIDRSFERDSKRLTQQAQQQVGAVIQKIKAAASLKELDVTKMDASTNAYRIRSGNYRIGFYMESDMIILSRVLDRKDIYRYFPMK